MKKVCVHKEVAFIVEVFFYLYKSVIFLNTKFRFGNACFMLKKGFWGKLFSFKYYDVIVDPHIKNLNCYINSY